MTKGAVCILGEIWSKYDPDIANTRYYMYIGCVNLSYRDILQFFYVDGPGISNQSSYADNRTDAVDRLLIVALIWRPHCTGPDRSAVDIQYAAVYTEGILPSIQCTCSIYWQFSITYTAAFRVPCIYTAGNLICKSLYCSIWPYCTYTST